MTKEQEAIERLENLVKLRKNKGGKIKYDNCICGTEDLETLLSMLKEKDAEIEKKDKQIDLMADFMIGGLEDIAFKAICKKSNCVYELKDNRPTKCRKCKDCIKQYFKRKAKE